MVRKIQEALSKKEAVPAEKVLSQEPLPEIYGRPPLPSFHWGHPETMDSHWREIYDEFVLKPKGLHPPKWWGGSSVGIMSVHSMSGILRGPVAHQMWGDNFQFEVIEQGDRSLRVKLIVSMKSKDVPPFDVKREFSYAELLRMTTSEFLDSVDLLVKSLDGQKAKAPAPAAAFLDEEAAPPPPEDDGLDVFSYSVKKGGADERGKCGNGSGPTRKSRKAGGESLKT